MVLVELIGFESLSYVKEGGGSVNVLMTFKLKIFSTERLTKVPLERLGTPSFAIRQKVTLLTPLEALIRVFGEGGNC